MNRKIVLLFICVLCLSLNIFGNTFAAKKATVVPAGTIKGLVTFTGTAPTQRQIQMNADPFCARAHSFPVNEPNLIVSAEKALKHVIVFLEGEVPGEFATPSAPAVLDQRGCLYEPRVQGMMSGQKLEVRNSDQTLHNVHCYRNTATCFNRAMFQKMPPFLHQFSDNGIVKFKCDVHPWMTAYALVSNHPFFAVTGADGTFEIKNVPAGTYTLKVWHETLGEQTLSVSLTAEAGAEANFQFPAVP